MNFLEHEPEQVYTSSDWDSIINYKPLAFPQLQES